MRPPWWFIKPRTCCLSVLAHGVPLCPAGRIDMHGTLLAFLGSWCAGPTPLRTKDRRSVCPHTVLPNPCWKRLSWQPSFCAPCEVEVPSTGQGWYTGPAHRYAVASVTPSRSWNTLLQPELDRSHVKQTQLKYRRSRCVLWKALSGRAVPSLKEAVWRWIVVACTAETVAVVFTESITVPRN